MVKKTLLIGAMVNTSRYVSVAVQQQIKHSHDPVLIIKIKFIFPVWIPGDCPDRYCHHHT